MGLLDHNLYFNLRESNCSDDISTVFPDWVAGDERVMVFSPHDDDAIIGAGYAMDAAMRAGADVFVVIFCRGDCGYTRPELRHTIVDIRRRETEAAYRSFGIPDAHLIRFDFPDFSASHYTGIRLCNGDTGSLPDIFRLIRDNRITRVLMPNDYREHTDHTAVFGMAAWDVVQAGDPIVPEWGPAQPVRSLLQYSVWSDFSPEDGLVSGAARGIRANRAILCPETVEERVQDAIRQFATQADIIQNLIESRKERKTCQGCIELYVDYDPRPKLDYSMYMPVLNSIMVENTKKI